MTRLLRGVAAYWRSNLDEIRHDSLVQAYFGCVLGTHVVTWLFLVDTRILHVAMAGIEPICWPYFEACWQFRFKSPATVGMTTAAYLGVTLAGLATLLERRIGWAWSFAIGANLLLFGVMSLDYRLRTNEFYMLFWLNLVFLLWPHKLWSVPALIVSFYFWAGTLKLNRQWIAGEGLYGPLWLIPDSWTWLACAYVVALELLLIWGLLSSRSWLRWLTLLQLALFHLQSLTQIHWFYPLLMGVILSWFVIDTGLGTRVPRRYLRLLLIGRAPLATYSVFAIFAVFQLAPLAYKGDHVFTGQGRILALHMFQARYECEVVARVRYEDGRLESRNLKMPLLPPRTVCDPVVYFSRAQYLCRSKGYYGIDDLDLSMRIRRIGDAQFVDVVDADDFCAAQHEYRILWPNSWMTTRAP